MEAVTPKQIAVQALKRTTIKQCRFTNFQGYDGEVWAVCASYLLLSMTGHQADVFSPACLVAVAYANDFLELSFKEIATFIQKNIIPVDMTGDQLHTFRREYLPRKVRRIGTGRVEVG